MSLSAASWAWKRPFVGSCSTSSPCASDTHSHRGQERGMALLTLPYCPFNWHIFKTSELLNRISAVGLFFRPTKVELTRSPKAKVEKKHGDAHKKKLLDFAGQQTLSVSERDEDKKIYRSWKRTGKTEPVYIFACCCFSFFQSSFVFDFFPLLLDTCRR